MATRKERFAFTRGRSSLLLSEGYVSILLGLNAPPLSYTRVYTTPLISQISVYAHAHPQERLSPLQPSYNPPTF